MNSVTFRIFQGILESGSGVVPGKEDFESRYIVHKAIMKVLPLKLSHILSGQMDRLV